MRLMKCVNVCSDDIDDIDDIDDDLKVLIEAFDDLNVTLL